MKIEQFVMAYAVEQDRIRALLPEGYTSLRPVLRINAEIRDEEMGYLELNTPVEAGGKRGWLNIANWENVPFTRREKTVLFQTDFLELSFTPVGIRGGCPAEKDNDGCFFADGFRTAEKIAANKEFCDCSFHWNFSGSDARGISMGKTLPAFYEEVKTQYPQQPMCAENAAAIPCIQVLGTYTVCFER